MAGAGGAAAAAAAEDALRRHQAQLERHFAARVEPLKENEHEDFSRWRGAIVHRVRQIPGALAALQDEATVTAAAAPPAMGALPVRTAAQFFQETLRTFIVASLPQQAAASTRRLLRAAYAPRRNRC